MFTNQVIALFYSEQHYIIYLKSSQEEDSFMTDVFITNVTVINDNSETWGRVMVRFIFQE